MCKTEKKHDRVDTYGQTRCKTPPMAALQNDSRTTSVRVGNSFNQGHQTVTQGSSEENAG